MAIFLMEYDPLLTAEKAKCPVLILHGDQDKLIPVADANRLAGAIRKGGNHDVTVHIFQGYNHAFINVGEAKKMEIDKKPLNEILKISPDVIDIISDWIVTKIKN